MTFLNPMLAAVGAGCVLVPILIHILMRRRRRPVEWGAMKFLLEAYRRQRRRMNLEQLLLLGTRCLLVLLLALALGRPILGAFASVAAGGPRTLVLLIDNSLTSTAAEPGGESGLARAKAAAASLLDTLDASRGDRAALVALGGPHDPVVLPPSGDLGVVRDQVAELAATESRGDLAGALARLAEDLSRVEGDLRVAVLSEFRAGSFETTGSLAALPKRTSSTTILACVPAETPLDNVAIVAMEPLRRVMLTGVGEDAGGASTTFRVTLRRFGPGIAQAGVTKVGVRVAPAGSDADSPRGEGVLRWTPGQAEGVALVSVELPAASAAAGRLVATASIDRDAVPGDNVYRSALDVRGRLEVAVLAPTASTARGTIDTYSPADWLTIALAPEADLAARRRQGGELRLSLIDPDRPAAAASTGLALADADAIIIPNPDLLDATAWDIVKSANTRGAFVLAMPPPGATTHLWTDAFLAATGLELTIAREATAHVPARGVSPRRVAEPDLLAFVAPELADLVKPVQVQRTLALAAPAGTMNTLLALDDDTPLIIASTPHGGTRGLVVLVTAAMHLSWTDLPTKPLMVPLFQELVRQGVGQGAAGRSALAGLPLATPASSVELLRVKGEGEGGPSARRIVPGGAIEPPVRHAGVFTARAATGQSLALFAVNADVAGSSTETRTRDEVAAWLSGLGSSPVYLDGQGTSTADGGVSAGESTHDVALPLLLAALVLGVVEAFFGRWFSHAGRTTTVTTGGAA